MMNIFKKLKEKEDLEEVEKQELLILKLKIIGLEWKLNKLKKELNNKGE